MLTDRDERALLAAAENRIAEPVRVRDALAAVRRLLRRERESLAWHPTTTHSETTSGTSGTSRNGSTGRNGGTSSTPRRPAAPLPR